MTRTRVITLAGRWGVLCGLLLMGMLLAGCKTASADPGLAGVGGGEGTNLLGSPLATNSAAASVPSSGSHSNDSVDVIRVQDSLVITLTDTPLLLQPFEDRVKDDGKITLTQNQKFDVIGKNRGELETEIYNRYVPRFFKTMTVSVRKTENTQFYYVGGEVKMPNRQIYLSRITVLKAIQSAQWFTDYANKAKVQLTRADGRIFTINCKKALRNPKLDLEVFPGDTITVPRRTW
jgi:protein involved in polysaccharide export with SLBB domain